MALDDLRLTFSDEFNSLSLDTGTKATDPNLWNSSMHNGYVRSLSGNKELQIYMDPDYKGLGVNPFSIHNGVLTIKATPASSSVKTATGYGYTSGALTTQGEFSQKYGYFEMRAQVPEGKGLWPAFWLLNDNQDWPPELDVMEIIGSETSVLHQSVHSDGPDSTKVTYAKENLSNAFHTYGMDWTKDKITFYLDGKATGSVTTPSDLHSSMYLVLNLAVGGTWPGSPNASTNWANAKYNIDYVRVYQHTGVDGSGSPAGGTASAPSTPATPAALSGLVLSNGTDISGQSGKKFSAADTGANSSKSYNASQLGLDGATSGKVAVSLDGEKNLKAVHNGAWNGVKNAAFASATAKEAVIENFVGVNVTLAANRDAVVTVKDAKRGSVKTGAGADKIAVTGISNGWTDNSLTIDSGDGDDSVSYTGENDNRFSIKAGNGNDTIALSDQAAGSIDAGAGDDRIAVRTTGQTAIAGGSGKDLFDLTSSSRVTISDFRAADDKLTIGGVSSSAVKVRHSGGDTFIEIGSAKIATLKNVTLSASQLGFGGATASGNTSSSQNAGAPNSAAPAFATGTDMPTGLLTPDAPFKDWPQTNVKFSNTHGISVMDGSTFTARKTGADTSTTYYGDKLAKIGGSNGSVTVSYDAQRNLTVTNNASWASVKNAAIRTSTDAAVTVKNMMGVDVDMSGDHGESVKIDGAMYGSVATGSGSDIIDVIGRSGSGGASNLMTISAGNGANQIGYSGTSGNRAAIVSGSGHDTITFSGQANGAIDAGAGDDRVNVRSSGNVAIAGGAGKDVFSFIAGAHATITDFKAGEDRLEIAGVSASAVHVRASGGDTFVALNGQNAVVLSGVSLNGSQIGLAFS